MSIPSKVLWGEGLFLRPQHFQQQDQYHEARLRRTVDALQPFLWGVQSVEWDTAALRTGTLRLHALSAMFRDGEMNDAPLSDPLPPAIDLGTLAPTVQEVTYYAALPALTGDGSNFAPPGVHTSSARYAPAQRITTDLYTQAAEADVTYLKKTVRLISDQEPMGAYERFPLIRLRRLASGGFEEDTDFIPPTLSVAGAPRLKTQLDSLVEALLAKVHALQGHLREPSKNVVEFRSGDVSSFWLMHTVSTATASLMHYQRQPQLHPERLYEAMLTLAGALMTYSKSHDLERLPPYRHDALGACFGELDDVIRDLLETVISSRYFAIALTEKKPCYHLGKLDSGKIDGKTTLYLAISAAMPALELVEVVPLRVKVGAPDDVDQCVLSAMPGVKLSHAPQVPAALPMRPETYYFALDSKGVLYEQMLKAQTIAIYVPAGIRDLALELVAVTA